MLLLVIDHLHKVRLFCPVVRHRSVCRFQRASGEVRIRIRLLVLCRWPRIRCLALFGAHAAGCKFPLFRASYVRLVLWGFHDLIRLGFRCIRQIAGRCQSTNFHNLRVVFVRCRGGVLLCHIFARGRVCGRITRTVVYARLPCVRVASGRSWRRSLCIFSGDQFAAGVRIGCARASCYRRCSTGV